MTWWVVDRPSGLPRDPGKLVWVETDTPPTVADQQVHGPYQTKAEADKVFKSLSGVTPGPAGGVGTAPGGGPGSGLAQQAHNAGGFSIPNPLSGLAAIGTALAKVVGYLGDVAMWKSLGWLLLGAIMIVLGISLWLRRSDLLPDVVPIPV